MGTICSGAEKWGSRDGLQRHVREVTLPDACAVRLDNLRVANRERQPYRIGVVIHRDFPLSMEATLLKKARPSPMLVIITAGIFRITAPSSNPL